MSFTSAQTVPYHPSQCPKCQLLVDDDRCEGFATKDPLGDMLGAFQGESDEPCSKFIPVESSVDESKTDQQSEVVDLPAHADKNEDDAETLVGFCEICGDPISQHFNFMRVVFHTVVNKGFNPYKTPGIDMSRSIQLSRALGTVAQFNNEEELKEALYQNWKKTVLQNFGDMGFCSKCNAAYDKATEKSGACFIATAAFQSPFSKEVDLLRIYRDTVLAKFFIGRYFIAVYYAISPSIALLIGRSKKLQYIARKILLPLIGFCERRF